MRARNVGTALLRHLTDLDTLSLPAHLIHTCDAMPSVQHLHLLYTARARDVAAAAAACPHCTHLHLDRFAASPADDVRGVEPLFLHVTALRVDEFVTLCYTASMRASETALLVRRLLRALPALSRIRLPRHTRLMPHVAAKVARLSSVL